MDRRSFKSSIYQVQKFFVSFFLFLFSSCPFLISFVTVVSFSIPLTAHRALIRNAQLFHRLPSLHYTTLLKIPETGALCDSTFLPYPT